MALVNPGGPDWGEVANVLPAGQPAPLLFGVSSDNCSTVVSKAASMQKVNRVEREWSSGYAVRGLLPYKH